MCVTLADVAGGARQHDVANIVRAALAHWNDVIAVVLLGQRLTAPKTPPLLVRISGAKLRRRVSAGHATTFELGAPALDGVLFRVVPFPPLASFAACGWIAGVLAGFILGPLLTIFFRVGLFLPESRTSFLRPFRL